VKLSIIIVNYNVCCFLELCLNSVFAATSSITTELIVVDNNSNDSSCEMIKEKFPNVVLIANKENIGFSKANNQGVKMASGEYICLLNPDTVVAEDTFLKLLSFSKSINNLGVLSCKLIDGSGYFLPESKRNVPTRLIAIKKLIGFSKSYYYSRLGKSEVGEVPIFVGAFMFLKKIVYENVGGFDERYFMYGEDIDLCYTILKSGYDNYYYGKTTIIHFKGESTLKDEVYAKRFYGAMQLFYNKYFKSSLLFDLIVKMGIIIIPFFKVIVKDKKIESRPELVLKTSQFSYKAIIDLIEKQDYHYSIHVENTNFMLSSKSSKSKGDIVYVS
jgi:GT2 family glycosyltransferase